LIHLPPATSPSVFGRRLIVAAVLINLMLATLAGVAVWYSRGEHQSRAELSTQNLALLLEGNLGTSIDRIDSALLVARDEIVRRKLMPSPSAQELESMLEALQRHLPEVEGLHATDASGRIIAGITKDGHQDSPSSLSIADRDYFAQLRASKESGLAISPPLIDRTSGKWGLILARRVVSADGRFAGAVVAPLSLEHFMKKLADIDVGEHGTIALRDGDLRLVIRHPAAESFRQLIGKRDAPPALMQLVAAGQRSGTFTARDDSDQRARIYAFSRIGEQPLYVSVGLDSEEHFADWRQESAVIVALTLLAALISLSAGILAWRAWRERNASEQRFRSLYQEAPLAYQSVDVADGHLLDVNAAWCDLFGYAREEAIGRPFSEFVDGAARELLAREFPRFVASGRLDGPVFDIRRKDGSLRQVAISGRIGYDANAQAQHTHCILVDISAQRQTEDTLRKLSRAVEQSQASIVITDVDGSIDYVNPHFCEVTGYRPEEVIGQNPRLLKTDFTSDDEYRRMWTALARGGTWRTEFLNRRKDGTTYWEDATISAITDDSGAVINYVAVKEDISARKLAEERASRLTSLYAALSMTSEAIVRITDPQALFEAVCRIAVTHGRLRAALIRKLADDGRVPAVAAFGDGKEALMELEVRLDAGNSRGLLPSAIALHEGRAFLCNDIVSDAQETSWRDTLRAMGIRSIATFPLQGGDEKGRYVLALYAEQPAFFDGSLLDLLNEMVLDLSYALDNQAREKAQRTAEAALRSSELRYRGLFESAQDAILIVNAGNSLIDEVNPVFEVLFAYPREKLCGHRLDEIPLLRDFFGDHHVLDAVGRLGSVRHDDVALTRGDGTPLTVDIVLSVYGEGEQRVVQCNLRDSSERQRLTQALRRQSSMFAVLSRTSQAIVHARDRNALLEQVCDIAMSIGDFKLAWIGRVAVAEQRIRPVASAGVAADYLGNIEVSFDAASPQGNGPAALAIRRQGAVLVNDCTHDEIFAPWRTAAAACGLHSCAALPVRGGDFDGVLVVYAGEANYFDSEVSALIGDVAQEMSYALQKLHDEDKARDSQARMRLHAQVFDHSTEAMVITDAGNRILQVNRAFSEITGYTLDEVLGKDPSVLKSGRQDHTFYQQMWAVLLATDSWQGELWNRRRNGEIYPEWITINLVRDAEGKVINHFAVFSDLTQKKAQEEMQRLRRFDALTGLPNRLLLEDRTVEAITHARPYARHVALMALNLDRFHVINESLGHAVGDEVLRLIANRLSGVIGELGTVSRLSGDTFAVMLPDLSAALEISNIAEKLLRAVAQPLLIEDLDRLTTGHPGVDAIHVTARAGIALFPEDGADFDGLLRNTESALLLARDEGRATYRFFTPELNVRAVRTVQLTTQLRQALDRNKLRVFYQPQVDTASGRIIGLEALVRMPAASGGMVSPAEFIPVAESTGMIGRLGEFVLGEACRQLKAWQEAGHRDLVMAVNLSPVQMRDPAVAERIAAVIAASGVDSRSVELEVTESSMMQNVDAALELLRQFKAMGLRLAIDDFGTGYSSLAYLKQFPIDRLKIDQSFVRNITSNASDASIVEAIIALARALGLTTLAEGVETETQFAHLSALRCEAMQGYLMARPLPADEISELLCAPSPIRADPEPAAGSSTPTNSIDAATTQREDHND